MKVGLESAHITSFTAMCLSLHVSDPLMIVRLGKVTYLSSGPAPAPGTSLSSALNKVPFPELEESRRRHWVQALVDCSL